MAGETVHTFCRVCEASCGMVAERENNVILRVDPDKSHPVTKGFCCAKGILALDMHHDEDRLNFPLKRKNPRSDSLGEFERVSWDQSAHEIGSRIEDIGQQYGKDAVSLYVGNPIAFNSLTGPAVESFAGKIGLNRRFGAGTQDCANKFAAAEAVFGSSILHPIPDIQNTDYILIIGGNPKISKMSFICVSDPMSKLKAAEKRGAKILYVNPRRIESSDDTGEVLLIKPDTDIYFLAALLFEIDRIGGFKEDLIEAHGKHIIDLRRFIKRYSPERVERIVGISSQKIRTIASDFSKAEKASVYMSTGVNMGRQGTLSYWLLQMLSFMTGNLDKVGGNIYAGDALPMVAAGKINIKNPFFNSPYGPLRSILGYLPGNLMSDMIESEKDPIRALLVISGNPVLSMGGEEKIRKAFKKLELLVVLDIYRTATGEMADYLLPCADMLERGDHNQLGLLWGVHQEPFVQFTDPVVTPRFERKEQWWILSRLEQAMGFESALDDQTYDPYHGINRILSAADLSISKLKNLPCQTMVFPRPKTGSFFIDWVQTDDKKVDCCPSIFEKSIETADDIFKALDHEPQNQLKLISLRNSFMQNSWYHNLEKLKKGVHVTNPIYINSKDAEKRGLEPGTRVRMFNSWGALEADIKIDDRLRDGVVAMAHGWGNQKTPGMKVAHQYPGVNVNQLLPTGPGSYEKISNQSHMTGIPVTIEKI